MKSMKFLIVIEKTKTGFSAYSPDLHGCVATAATRDKVEEAMKEAIEFHLEGMRAERIKVPAPHSYSTYVEVPA
jgi:predicted RNase H-like HicB family nuclease